MFTLRVKRMILYSSHASNRYRLHYAGKSLISVLSKETLFICSDSMTCFNDQDLSSEFWYDIGHSTS